MCRYSVHRTSANWICRSEFKVIIIYVCLHNICCSNRFRTHSTALHNLCHMKSKPFIVPLINARSCINSSITCTSANNYIYIFFEQFYNRRNTDLADNSSAFLYRISICRKFFAHINKFSVI